MVICSETRSPTYFGPFDTSRHASRRPRWRSRETLKRMLDTVDVCMYSITRHAHRQRGMQPVRGGAELRYLARAVFHTRQRSGAARFPRLVANPLGASGMPAPGRGPAAVVRRYRHDDHRLRHTLVAP